MKVFIHIANHYITTDPKAMVVVECDGVPRKGDLFYMGEENRKSLEDQIRKNGGYGQDWIYMKGTGRGIFSIEDARYVDQVSWEKDEQGIFRCHIELGDGFSR